jgi:hypothetical protein
MLVLSANHEPNNGRVLVLNNCELLGLVIYGIRLD